MVNRGNFQLFNQDSRQPDTKNLTYDFDMISPNGKVLHFHGYKVVNPSVAFDPYGFWKATSTLYVTISHTDEKIIGRGTLNIQPTDFGSELATMLPTGPNMLARAGSVVNFLGYFTKQAASIFLAPLSFLQWPTSISKDFINVTSATRTVKLLASDGVQTTMQTWDAIGQNSSVKAPSILFVPGAAVDHQIFALPTIEKNAVNYFREAGYRIYCTTHRVGRTKVAEKGYTTFDARLDILAALAHIREESKARTRETPQKVYVIAHCAGSVALSAGLLDGTIPAHWIKGITASNVFMNPKFAKVNLLKASLPLPLNDIYSKVAGSWFNCTSSRDDSYIQMLLNQALRFYPVGSRAELCSSIVCHRSSLVFGR
jgi:hypothetical protein